TFGIEITPYYSRSAGTSPPPSRLPVSLLESHPRVCPAHCPYALPTGPFRRIAPEDVLEKPFADSVERESGFWPNSLRSERSHFPWPVSDQDQERKLPTCKKTESGLQHRVPFLLVHSPTRNRGGKCPPVCR